MPEFTANPGLCFGQSMDKVPSRSASAISPYWGSQNCSGTFILFLFGIFQDAVNVKIHGLCQSDLDPSRFSDNLVCGSFFCHLSHSINLQVILQAYRELAIRNHN